MRKAVEGLAGRIDGSESKNSKDERRHHYAHEARARHQRGRTEHEEHDESRRAHASRDEASKSRKHEPEGLHILSEKLDSDVESGERALKRGNVKLAEAKLAAATRLRQSECITESDLFLVHLILNVAICTSSILFA
jgi:hypothetical protein